MIKAAVLVLVAALVFPVAAAQSPSMIIAMTFRVTNDTAELLNATVMPGSADDMHTSGDYSIALENESGREIYRNRYDLNFYVYDANVFTREVMQFARVPYSTDAKTVKFYYNGRLMLSRGLELCSNDGICNKNENAISCPSDCNPRKPDGYCNPAADGICDPDCLPGYDPDCKSASAGQPGTGGSSFPWGLLAAFIILAGVLAFLVLRRRKAEESYSL